MRSGGTGAAEVRYCDQRLTTNQITKMDLIDDHYQHASAKFKQQIPEVEKLYQDWKTAVMKDGVLDKKTKELIALGVSAAIQCLYCIDSHKQKAKAFGASEKEIAEAIWVAASIKAGSTISHGVNALKE